MTDKRLYSFEFDFGRGYEGCGVFHSTPDKIKKLIGQTISFGEICGKHSEVDVDITEDMIKDITDESDISIGLDLNYYVPQFDLIVLDSGEELTIDGLEDYEVALELRPSTKSGYFNTTYTVDNQQIFIYDEVIDSRGIVYKGFYCDELGNRLS
jgi:hypothetical protein